jgi:hypothetical protein
MKTIAKAEDKTFFAENAIEGVSDEEVATEAEVEVEAEEVKEEKQVEEAASEQAADDSKEE